MFCDIILSSYVLSEDCGSRPRQPHPAFSRYATCPLNLAGLLLVLFTIVFRSGSNKNPPHLERYTMSLSVNLIQLTFVQILTPPSASQTLNPKPNS